MSAEESARLLVVLEVLYEGGGCEVHRFALAPGGGFILDLVANLSRPVSPVKLIKVTAAKDVPIT
jgi:hypothetical protein